MPGAKKLASFFAVFVETLSGRSILKGNSNVPRSATFRQIAGPNNTDATTAKKLANAQLASSYRYTMANNQVVLVDPLTMQVLDIIRQ